jgi:hypothetical protein
MGNTGEAAKDRCQIVADGVFNRRQLSTTERIAADLRSACGPSKTGSTCKMALVAVGERRERGEYTAEPSSHQEPPAIILSKSNFSMNSAKSHRVTRSGSDGDATPRNRCRENQCWFH